MAGLKELLINTGAEIEENVPMGKYTSFRAGGRAAVVVCAGSEQQLLSVLSAVSNAGVPHTILGNGTNTLFRDSGYQGVVIRLGSGFSYIEEVSGGDRGKDGEKVYLRCGASVLLSSLARNILDRSLTGFEFASGIPGSLGGALFMNAGAYGGEMKDIVTEVRAVSPDGSEITGDYDLVPILDRFVEEHPDFSYRGAKACLAFTGYNGILGYRTDETYDPDSDMYDSEKKANENIEADRETARQVISCLKDAGYELASHSWGHKNYTDISYDHMKRDADRWDKNVNKELMDGECDIILFPFGADVGDWHMYTHDNAKFDYLWDLGFRYFCNVDSSQYWVQLGKDYMRQGRRNLDGYAMWNDIANGKNRLSDLFDASEIFSDKRPTPVPGY